MIFNYVRLAGPGAPDATIPEAPANVSAETGDSIVEVTWFASLDPDVSSYNLYRSTSSGTGYTKIVSETEALAYSDTGRTNGVTYYYVVTALDEVGNESEYSSEIAATPVSNGTGTGVAYLYYRIIALDDNSYGSADMAWREFKGYESSDNTGTNVFNTLFDEALASSAPNEDQNAFLEDPSLYWYSFSKVSGNHQWLGVKLTTPKVIRSITLDPYAAFWQPRTLQFQGSNNGSTWTPLKTFTTAYDLNTDTVVNDIQGSDTTGDVTPPAAPTGVVAVASDTEVSLSWSANTENDLAGYSVYRSTTSGSGFSKISGPLQVSTSYLDSGLSNDTTYYYYVTASDTTLPANESTGSSEVSGTPTASEVVIGGPITIEVVDRTWQAVQLKWTQDTGVNQTVVIQRKTTNNSWVDPDLNQPQSPENYRRLGSKAFMYWDQRLEPNTTYYYRVAAITNASEHANSGATPTFSSWKYGQVTTKAVSFQVFNVTSYGADPTGASNSYTAIVNCYAAALAARSETVVPIVRFNKQTNGSKATYVSYPIDANVLEYGGSGGQSYVTYANRSNYDSYLFTLRSNIIIEGELSNSGERPELQVKQWHNKNSTTWLARLASGGSNPNVNSDLLGTGGSNGIVRHGFAAIEENTTDCVVRHLFINGTGTPVNRGKEWYTADQKRYEWDISHKGIASWRSCRNIVTYNCKMENFRAEILYKGGLGMENWLIEDCQIGKTNSSAISGSTSVEIVNCNIYDASNASVESAIYHNLTSAFTGQLFTQYHILRDTQCNLLDQRDDGVFKSLPGSTTFSGPQVFNEAGTWVDISDTHITDIPKIGVGLWYGVFNASTWRVTLDNFVNGNDSKQIFSFTIFPKAQYLLDGGMEDCLFLDTTISLNSTLGNGSALLYSINSLNGSMNNVIFDLLRVNGNGYGMNRIWSDNWNHATGRDNFVFRNWSYTNMSTQTFDFLVDQTPYNRIQPEFENFDFHTLSRYVPSSGQVFLGWNKIALASGGTPPNVEFINISKLKEGQIYTISVASNSTSKTFTLPPASWNTWGSAQTLTGSQTLQVRRAAGQTKLEVV